MRTADSKSIAVYVLLTAGVVSLLRGIYGLTGAQQLLMEDIALRLGSPIGIVLLALSMLTRSKAAARSMLFMSIAVLVAVLIIDLRHLIPV